MSLGDWREYGEWHRLFDALCNHYGFYDNNGLAAEFCARIGRKQQEDFEAAKKKLRTWRTGQRIPRRGNFSLVSAMLEVKRDPELERHWNGLYKAARNAGPLLDDGGLAREQVDTRCASAGPPRWLHRWIAIGAFSVFGFGLVIAPATDSREAALSNLPGVGYDAHVRLSVGTSRLVHGEFEDCNGPPPEWERVADKVPSTSLGTFADGGLARKMVNDCGKEMVVRAVMFTGLTVGAEEVRLLDDYMKIEVVDSASRFTSGGSQ